MRPGDYIESRITLESHLVLRGRRGITLKVVGSSVEIYSPSFGEETKEVRIKDIRKEAVMGIIVRVRGEETNILLESHPLLLRIFLSAPNQPEVDLEQYWAPQNGQRPGQFFQACESLPDRLQVEIGEEKFCSHGFNVPCGFRPMACASNLFQYIAGDVDEVFVYQCAGKVQT